MKNNSMFLIFLSLISFVFTTGCWMVNKEIVRPEIPETIPQPVIKPAPGSIWRGETDKNMLFIDKKARYINDIVTIIVAESVQGQNKAATGTSRDSTASASIDAFLGVENSIINNNTNMGGQIALGGKSANALKGSGDTSRNTTLVARISARVVRVLDNGNLLVEGRRQVTVNAEDQYLMISGIVRPQDITADNTVASQYVADARIVYTGEGVVNDKMRPGWMTRIVDWVWPF